MMWKETIIIFLALLAFLIAFVFASPATVSIRGAKVTLQGGYLAVSSTQSATAGSLGVEGQCIGILCGVTYSPN